jgi:hypothetical protein
LEALAGFLAFVWLILTLSWVLTFIGPARRAIARSILVPYHISLRRARWAVGLSAMMALVAFVIITPPEKQSSPSGSATTAPNTLSEPAVVPSESETHGTANPAPITGEEESHEPTAEHDNEPKFELVGVTYLNASPAACKTPELVAQFNRAWKAVSEPLSTKLMLQVSSTTESKNRRLYGRISH